MAKPAKSVDPYIGALAVDALRLRLERTPSGICYVCGCTDFEACDPPCYWADANLCNSALCMELDEAVR